MNNSSFFFCKVNSVSENAAFALALASYESLIEASQPVQANAGIFTAPILH